MGQGRQEERALLPGVCGEEMTFIDLCAGIGGFSLGLEWAGMICEGQVEIDEYCTRVLQKHWPHVQKWGDIKAIVPGTLPTVDLICGGYPCQPFSQAGKRRGADDDRHLWPFISEIVAHIRPAWCLFENVAGHVSLGLDEVLSDMESKGYDAIPLVIPACSVDAPHIRKRVWIVAYSNSARKLQQKRDEQKKRGRSGDSSDEGRLLGHPAGEGFQDRRSRQVGESISVTEPERSGSSAGFYSDPCVSGCQKQHASAFAEGTGYDPRSSDSGWRQWTVEPGICRVVDGIPNRVDRIKALGNAVVPQVVYEIGRAIMAAHYAESGTEEIFSRTEHTIAAST